MMSGAKLAEAEERQVKNFYEVAAEFRRRIAIAFYDATMKAASAELQEKPEYDNKAYNVGFAPAKLVDQFTEPPHFLNAMDRP